MELTVAFQNAPKKSGEGGGLVGPPMIDAQWGKQASCLRVSTEHAPLAVIYPFQKPIPYKSHTCQLLSNNEASEKCCHIKLQQLTPTKYIQFTANRVRLQVLKTVQSLAAPRGA